MAKHLSRTAREAPTSAALKFVQKSNSEPANQIDTQPSDVSPKATTTRKPRRQASQRSEKPTYQPFSTRLRSDLKRRLKRLSYEREEQDAEVKSVQQFVEEAILKWLDSQDDVSARN